MADIFISYKRDERAQVTQLAEALRALGLSIWFDASLSAGEAFSDEIDREAREAKAILVCWSPGARSSRWVKAEAEIGFAQDKLAAAYVAGEDGFAAPVPFNTVHAEDLRAWLNAPQEGHAGWRSLLRRLGRLCGRADLESWGSLDAQATPAQLSAWLSAHAASPMRAVVQAMLAAREEVDARRAEMARAQEQARRLDPAHAVQQADVEAPRAASDARIRWTIAGIALVLVVAAIATYWRPAPSASSVAPAPDVTAGASALATWGRLDGAPLSVACARESFNLRAGYSYCGVEFTAEGHNLSVDDRGGVGALSAGYDRAAEQTVWAESVLVLPRSPSGRFVVVEACPPSLEPPDRCRGNFLIHTDTGSAYEITLSPKGPERWIAWSSDEKYAILVARDEDVTLLYAVDTETGATLIERMSGDMLVEATLRWLGSREFEMRQCAECGFSRFVIERDRVSMRSANE